jgi:uncharacterized Fe-S cluster-containing radical SAM superfamily protein
MDGEFLKYQFRACQYLLNEGISCNAAIMAELLDEDNFKLLANGLKEIDNDLAQNLEIESLIMYPFIESELTKRGLDKNFKPL